MKQKTAADAGGAAVLQAVFPICPSRGAESKLKSIAEAASDTLVHPGYSGEFKFQNRGERM